MVANPKISRINGAKSKGPISKLGKIKASRNAVKHGFLSQQPPVLITEDLEYFQDILQGMTNDYKPKGTVESLLVRQIAMAWLRLNRLWNVEAATGNLEILKIQKAIEFPDINIQSSNPYAKKLLESLPKSHNKLLEEEIIKFKNIMDGLQEIILDFPNKSNELNDWITSIWTILSKYIRKDQDQFNQLSMSKNFWKENSEIMQKLAINTMRFWNSKLSSSKNTISNEIKSLLETLYCLAEQSSHILQSRKQELMNLNLAIAETNKASKGLVSTEMIARYERHITRQLNEALDRLTKLQNQRKNGGCIGSFGRKDDSEPVHEIEVC
jgi:hypothetical protein